MRFGYPLAKCITGITLICVRVPAWSAELDIREQLGPPPLEGGVLVNMHVELASVAFAEAVLVQLSDKGAVVFGFEILRQY